MDVGGGDGFAWAIAFNAYVLDVGDPLAESGYVANVPLVEMGEPCFYRIQPGKCERVTQNWVPPRFKTQLAQVSLQRALEVTS